MLSAYPLQSITLGENLLGVIGGVLKLDRSNRGVVMIFRLVASVPPLIVRLIDKNSVILNGAWVLLTAFPISSLYCIAFVYFVEFEQWSGGGIGQCVNNNHQTIQYLSF